MDRWGTTYRGLAKYLNDPSLFQFFDFPEPVRKSLYTFNIVEGFNSCLKAKVRRRVTANTIDNCTYVLLTVSVQYNESRRQRRVSGWSSMTDEELGACGMVR